MSRNWNDPKTRIQRKKKPKQRVPGEKTQRNVIQGKRILGYHSKERIQRKRTQGYEFKEKELKPKNSKNKIAQGK